jgi:hypothetical protein
VQEKIIILFFLGFVAVTLKAQTKQITHESFYWTRYYNQIAFGDRWTWHNEIDERRFFKNNEHLHIIAHSRVHYKILPKVELGAGFTYSLQKNKDPNLMSTLDIPELRPNQEISYSNSISKRWKLQQRFRIDERFFRKNDGHNLTDGYDFNFRFRYRMQAAFRINKEEIEKSTTLKVADEIMLNTGKKIVYNTFDQNRIYAALEQGLSQSFSVELGYMYLYQQRPAAYHFFERDIIRLTIFQKIKL